MLPITDSGCIEWPGARNNKGYGRLDVYRQGKKTCTSAHRVAYEQHKGPIPPGLEIDHLCGNPACVNPEHLEAVTHRENVRRGKGWAGKNARKTRCPQGHKYAPENTYHTASGRRLCKACNRARYYRSKAEAR